MATSKKEATQNTKAERIANAKKETDPNVCVQFYLLASDESEREAWHDQLRRLVHKTDVDG